MAWGLCWPLCTRWCIKSSRLLCKIVMIVALGVASTLQDNYYCCSFYNSCMCVFVIILNFQVRKQAQGGKERSLNSHSWDEIVLWWRCPWGLPVGVNYINDAVTPTVLHGARWPPRRESWQRGSAIKQRAGRRNQRKAEYSPMPFLPKHCPRTELGRGWGRAWMSRGTSLNPAPLFWLHVLQLVHVPPVLWFLQL